MQQLTVSIEVNVPVEKAWEIWGTPEHIMQWCHASDDWHTPYATNDLRTGGEFTTAFAAVDGSMAFDFTGTYSEVRPFEYIAYTITGGRDVSIHFERTDTGTRIVEKFDAEDIHTAEQQIEGWQAILVNFKKHAESVA